MPKYPRLVEPWMSKPYGGEARAWDEAKEQCRDLLVETAAAERPITYGELARRVTVIQWPEGAFTHNGQQMGYLLGQVSLDALDELEDRPVLSSLVVGQDEGMPSRGYWTFLRDTLGIDVPADELGRMTLWVKDFEAACRYYGRPHT